MVCGQAVTDLAPATPRKMVAGRSRASGGWGVAEGPPSGDPQLLSPAVLERRQARHLAASADACRSPRQCAHAPHTTCLVSEHTQVNSKNINSHVSTVQNQHTQVNSKNINTRKSTVKTSTHTCQQYKINTHK